MAPNIHSARLAFVSRSQSKENTPQDSKNETAMASNSSTLYDTLSATAEAFLESFDEAFKTRDVDKLSSTLTPQCIRRFAPDSLFTILPRLRPGLTITEYQENEAEIFTTYSVCENSIVDKTVDEKARKVVIQTRHHTELKGTVFDFEHMITLRMTDDGTKVKDVQHFVDTLVAARFLEGSEAGKHMKEKTSN